MERIITTKTVETTVTERIIGETTETQQPNQRIRGLDFEKAKYKLPLDYEGLPGYWSDTDAWQRTNEDTLILVEEKAFVNWDKEETCKRNNKWLVDNFKAPAIVLFTSTHTDHKALGQQFIPLKNTIVEMFYTNSEKFNNAFGIKPGRFCTNISLEITRFLEIWYERH